MRVVFLIVLNMLLGFIAYSENSKHIMVSISKNYCLTCSRDKINLVVGGINKQSKIKNKVVITNINNMQIKHYKAEIDAAFNNFDIVYDIDKKYKNQFALKKEIEYFVIDSKDSIYLRTDNLKLLVECFLYKPGSIDLYEEKSRSIIYNEDNILLNPTKVLIKGDELVVYDSKQNNLNCFDLNELNKYSKIELDDLLKRNKILTKTPKFGNNHKIKYFSKLNSFFQSDEMNCLFVSVVDSIRYMTIPKENSIDTILSPVYSHYVVKLNSDWTFSETREINFQNKFLLNGGSEALVGSDGSYFAVYDRGYHHSKHNSLKDTTALLISIKSDNSITKSINIGDIEKITGQDYSIFFSNTYYQFGKYIYLLNPENNVFLKYSIENKTTSKFIEPKGLLTAIIDSSKHSSNLKYLDGYPYNRNNYYSFAGFCLLKDFYIIALRKFEDLVGREYSNVIMQVYNLKGEFL